MHVFNKKKSIRAIAMLMMLVFAAAAVFSGCSGKKKIKVPAGLTKEEAALYTAVANVCPKDDNHSKADYLTFLIEGWSFDTLPAAVTDYITEYAANGNAALLQFDFEKLVEMGYIKQGEADSYYDGQKVYAEGKGIVFTFKLAEGENPDSDSLKVNVEKYISDEDHSGYDVELVYEKNVWKFVKNSNPWYQPQFQTEDPNSSSEPLR